MMVNPAELVEAFHVKQQEDDLLAKAQICQQFKDSPMYALLDQMLEAFELTALADLKSYDGMDRDAIALLTIKWRQAARLREQVHVEIDAHIYDAQRILETRNDNEEVRTEIEHGS